MLGPNRVDTNSLKLTSALETYGVPLVRKSVVGDSLGELVDEIRYSLNHSEILITSGGLGPTEDDLTREALAEAFGLSMQVDRSLMERLEARFAARGMKMAEVNRKQANVFRGQTALINERGTAPGFHLQVRGKHVWVFPGVPHEIEWMTSKYLTPWLDELLGSVARYRRVIKVTGLGESAVEERIKPYYDAHPKEPLTILATSGGVELHVMATGAETDARAQIAEHERELLALLGDKVFGFDDDLLESVVGSLLLERKATLATAESCTGGLLGSRITDIAGSSRYYLGGGVCYTGDAKVALANVDRALLVEHGEVSEPVAIALARGVRERFGSTYGIGITGILGPGGGSEAKPVGTVHIAVAGPEQTEHRKLFWPMERTLLKRFATQSALDLLRLFMLRG